MVAGVPEHPHGVADAYQADADNAGRPLVHAFRGEDLPVRRLLGQEAELGEENPQTGGDEQ
jgi:hypothetical protein